MKLKGLLAITGAVVAAVVLIASAGAGTATPSKASPLKAFKLTTRAGALSYLRAQGVDLRTVVVQRGQKNYAGPNCPGKGWNCTRARHVVQFASTAAAADNTFVCDPEGPGSDGPTICVIVQVNTTGDNTANCTETNGDAPVSLSCSITQTNVSGDNNSNVDQEITQVEFGEISTQTQNGTETATVDQENGTGANHSVLLQTIEQVLNNVNTVIHQTQTGDQTASVLQNSVSGAQSSQLTQSQTQFEQQGSTIPSAPSRLHAAASVVSGTQSQTGNGTATVDQHSTGVSTSDNEQDMNQSESVPSGSDVRQTQIGPFRCCSHQDTNPNDEFSLIQTKHQSTSGTTDPGQFASLDGELHTTGTGTVTQSITQNGDETDDDCSVTNGGCHRTLVASNGDATDPSVRIDKPVDGGVYKLGQNVPAEFKCKDQKSSGIASCVGTVAPGRKLDTSTVGDHTFTVTATDKAGNVTVVTRHYTVVYDFDGFSAPVGKDPRKLNVSHAGDLLKLSFGLHGNQGPDILAAGSPTSVEVPCPTPDGAHSVPGSSSTPGLSFQPGPGPSDGKYTFGWQTSPAWVGTCRQFQLQLNDGTAPHIATFLFT